MISDNKTILISLSDIQELTQSEYKRLAHLGKAVASGPISQHSGISRRILSVMVNMTARSLAQCSWDMFCTH